MKKGSGDENERRDGRISFRFQTLTVALRFDEVPGLM